MGRVVLDAQAAAELRRVVGVGGLVGERVEVEALHDVDLAAVGPALVLLVEGHEPEGGPGAARALQLGADLDAAAVEGVLAARLHAAGQVGSRVRRAVVVDDAAQDEPAVAQREAAVVRRVVVVPVGSAARNAAPDRRVEAFAVELLLPDQLPAGFGAVGAGGHEREKGQQQSESFHRVFGVLWVNNRPNVAKKRQTSRDFPVY